MFLSSRQVNDTHGNPVPLWTWTPFPSVAGRGTTFVPAERPRNDKTKNLFLFLFLVLTDSKRSSLKPVSLCEQIFSFCYSGLGHRVPFPARHETPPERGGPVKGGSVEQRPVTPVGREVGTPEVHFPSRDSDCRPPKGSEGDRATLRVRETKRLKHFLRWRRSCALPAASFVRSGTR